MLKMKVYTDGDSNYITDEPEEDWIEVECDCCNTSAKYLVAGMGLCSRHYWDSLFHTEKVDKKKLYDTKFKRKRLINYHER